MTEQEIDQTIEEIEKEWYANGFVGDVRADVGLIYEVVVRLVKRSNLEIVKKEVDSNN